MIKNLSKLSKSALACTMMCRNFTEMNILIVHRFPVIFENMKKRKIAWREGGNAYYTLRMTGQIQM